MIRVANALSLHAPKHVTIVDRRDDADLVVTHVIGPGDVPDQTEVVIQYCLLTAGLDDAAWISRWNSAKLVWSYYDLPSIVGQNGFSFYHAPLGVDDAFIGRVEKAPRDIGILTSGYVAGPSAEAIEEVALASWMLNLSLVHLGPKTIEGMKFQSRFPTIHDVRDEELASYYRRCNWVSGLRHTEGFELPIVEGLCCGARPIVFDRTDMHQWYAGHAAFVPERTGHELVKDLLEILSEPPEPVEEDERQWAIERFSWKPIVKGFWERALA